MLSRTERIEDDRASHTRRDRSGGEKAGRLRGASDSSWGLGHFTAWPRHRSSAQGVRLYKTHLLIVVSESRFRTWLDGRPLDSRVVSLHCDSEGSVDPIKAQLFREVLA
jgi:hypothetical protein